MVVPVRAFNRPSVVEFAGGAHGSNREAGKFAFWTAVLKTHPGKGVTGRAYLTLPPGERFDRIRRSVRHRHPETAKAYGRMWRMLKNNVSYVRPSTIAEISRWANGHMPDWKYAFHAQVGKAMYLSPALIEAWKQIEHS